ncbi:unannotated protein [freshwater metagenome]|uniref:Unannotated protein n=1 Tax=freshwater metagenome TaxID=449393 RepID=A0A6J6P181_9ZZZZ
MRMHVTDTAHAEGVHRLEFDAINRAIGMAHFNGSRFHFASTLLPLQFVANVAHFFRLDDVVTPGRSVGRFKNRYD